MQNLQDAIFFIESDEYLEFVVRTNKWCSHGSNIIEYFEDSDMIYEFSNYSLKKKILKKYIKLKLKEILDTIKEENPSFLYRAIYSDDKSFNYGFYGHHWSFNKNTNICYEISNMPEVLLVIKFDYDIIDWKETLMARLDYLFGEKEKEYYLKNESVPIFHFEIR